MKVTVKAYYYSSFSMQMVQEWEFDSIVRAKEFIEGNMDEISKPQYKLESVTDDVTRFTAFSFSHLDIINQ